MQIHKFVMCVLIASVISSIASPLACAQLTGEPRPGVSAANYYYVSKPGEVTMELNIWGCVKTPGRYEVPASTDLIQLMSYAGGPTENAKLERVSITRIIKTDKGPTYGEYFLDLRDMAHVSSGSLKLNPGDTVFLDETGWSSFRDILTVAATAAIITSAIANIVIANRVH
jgi:protein involved in polysaccharide export with SLBB domain